MLDTLFTSTITESLNLWKTLFILASALALGFVISLGYIQIHKREGYSPAFTVTLIMLPAIISIIILMIGDNIARAFSLAGAFSLIRFRSAPGDPKDIAYVFFTLAVGLACGMGYVGYGAMFTLILSAVMLVLNALQYARPSHVGMTLKITIPENLNHQGLFDDILNTYTESWRLNKVSTSEFGALFNLNYTIQLEKDCAQKEFLDELRCRNGNLAISLTLDNTADPVYM